ncbi:MAG: efflux RND transporter permease subunit, partial [Burkholderiales bacterium]
VLRRAVDIALDTPGVKGAVNFVGFSGATFTQASNSGAAFLVLEPFEKRAGNRAKSAAGIQAELFKRFAPIQDALLLVILPPPVAGIGNGSGFRMMVEDRGGRGPVALQNAVFAMMGKAAQTPGVSQVFSLFETSTPQLYLDIDRTKAQLLGVRVPDVFAALQIYIGSSYVNDFNLFGRTYRVIAQAESGERLDPKDVLRIRVRNASGETVPLGSFTTMRDMSGPFRVPRYNLYPAAELDGAAAPGFSQGQAIEIMARLAAETLPDGFGYEWTTLAFQQLRAGNTAMFAFVLAVVFVFLVLAAQFESFRDPFIVLAGSVPLAVSGALLFSFLGLTTLNIYSQVGLITLVGLVAKNGILIVQFANHLQEAGRDKLRAVIEASGTRLRPI